jgi:MFS family permease
MTEALATAPLKDRRLLFATRFLRMLAYGFLSVVLVLYLAAAGLSDGKIGVLLTLTLLGDAAVSLLLTTTADRFGRRKTLVIGALLMLLGGGVFAATKSFTLLLLAATIGVISPSGNEVGPFLSVEQAAISQVIPDDRRTSVFAWYNLVGSVATAIGALLAGWSVRLLQDGGLTQFNAFRVVLLAYAAIGVALALLFLLLSRGVEVDTPTGRAAEISGARAFLGLHESKGIVARLSALFALDAFAGGFVIQSMVAYWFHVKFGVAPETLGAIFFGANLFAAASSLLAPWMVSKVGLINVMVFTHLPSNVLLILVPLMPNLGWAIAMLLARFSISQMDVPTRQAYTVSVVKPDERSAASGITGVARTLGAAISPSLAGLLMANPALMGAPFVISGGLKIVYDVLIYRGFKDAPLRGSR